MAFVNVHDATGAILFRYDAARNLIEVKSAKLDPVLVDLERYRQAPAAVMPDQPKAEAEATAAEPHEP